MAKAQHAFLCSDCGATTVKWQGQCPACGGWNTLEARLSPGPVAAVAGVAPVRRLSEVGAGSVARIDTGLVEFNRSLGGGLVPGSVVLIGGDPGIGKSTLLLQATACLSQRGATLYVSGEESLEQISLRGQRLGVDLAGILALATTRLEDVLAALRESKAGCVVIDSIQTMATDGVPSAPGTPNQLRSCASVLVRVAKQEGITVVLVGHVTKEGLIAGPRLLEHMVDAVLYFESETGSRYRILRAVKNRFGAANEIGIFVMTEGGFREVRNPSAMFVAQRGAAVPGSAVTSVHQGTRPLLVEVQALADQTSGQPRRVAIGMDGARLTLLLAVLHRHAGMTTHHHDVFVNVVGGVRILETSADLAALLATVSSLSDRPLPRDLLVFGEVGLAGEIRPVAWGEERLREGLKAGFRRAIVPRANLPRQPLAGMEVTGVDALRDVMRMLPALHALVD